MNLILQHAFSTTMNNISNKLTNWYSDHKRNLPWRHTNDPYIIWLSEIILQQTRVEQGRSYFEKFVDSYPTVQDLANAPLDEVLKLWQGLGYYSRARNLHFTANYVCTNLQGVFPSDYSTLLSLKGIGTYTAAAISSFSINEKKAVVDGNVYRVLARLFNNATPINSTKGKRVFQEYADKLLHPKNSGLHNQAIMEFGALHCTPSKPNCMYCPLQNDCASFEKGTSLSLPVKEKKIKTKNRYFHYYVHTYKNTVALQQRSENDIWRGLFEFQLIESGKALMKEEGLNLLELNSSDFTVTAIGSPSKHILSHQHIYAQFYHLQWNKPPTNLPNTLNWYDASGFKKLAIPRLIDRYLESSYSIFADKESI